MARRDSEAIIDKDYKLPDGAGLSLLMKVYGAEYWRYRYTFASKERMLAIELLDFLDAVDG